MGSLRDDLIALRRQGVRFVTIKCGVEGDVPRKAVEVTPPPVPPPDAALLESWFRANLPPGVRLLEWDLKPTPIAIDRCSAVIDPPQFVTHDLEELRIALAYPRRAVGWTAAELVQQLRDAGVVLGPESEPQAKQ
jgi:hypothetical protein